MMIAMMTPTAAPMVLTFMGLQRQRGVSEGSPWLPTVAFLGGYGMVWIGFSVLATLAQDALRSAALLTPCAMRTASPWLGAALLMSAGLFQFSSIKSACLSHCRTPVGFLLSEWRDGTRGALQMGVRHGLFCTGCCWLLMLLLFVAGVMNTACCAALAVLVLLEKALPYGIWLARAAGILLAVSSIAVVAGCL
jgi:predicted metal-binding membrane protein